MGAKLLKVEVHEVICIKLKVWMELPKSIHGGLEYQASTGGAAQFL
jgi:hypothetical protein